MPGRSTRSIGSISLVGYGVPLQAFGFDGKPTDSQVAITPIGVHLSPTLLQIVGTGFFIARYGLLLTAKHVVDEIAVHDAAMRPSLTWFWKQDGTLRFRPILTCSFFDGAPRGAADIAICQTVDRVIDGIVHLSEPNERIAIVTRLPEPGTQIATYAYPGNAEVDFSGPARTGKIFADAFEGEVLALRGPAEGFLRYSHVETSIEVRGGASGGPVFGPGGHAFAVNCRGWQLESNDDAGPLSSAVPVSLVLDMKFQCPHLPPGSDEERSTPEDRRTGVVTLRELAAWGHISIDP